MKKFCMAVIMSLVIIVCSFPAHAASAIICSQSGTLNLYCGQEFKFTVTSDTTPVVTTGSTQIASVDLISKSGNVYSYDGGTTFLGGGTGVFINGIRYFVINTKEIELTDVEQDHTKIKAQMLALCNKYREAAGLDDLAETAEMDKAADIRAKEISVLYSHLRPDGRCTSSVLTDLGISYNAGSEVIVGEDTGNDGNGAIAAWKDSPGHWDDIMTPDWTAAGFGVYDVDNAGRFFVIDFIR
jgi:uncharacterized protein YkwD